MNIDAKENTVIISVQIVANISLGIIAVDRCGVKSASSSITLPVNSSNYCTDGIVKPSTNLTQQNIMSTSCAQSSGVSAAFAILVLIIIALFVISIVLVIFVIILSRKEREEVELSSVHYGGLHEDGDDQKHNDDQGIFDSTVEYHISG